MKPSNTITEKAADYLAKIVEIVTRLEFGTGFARDIRLHREKHQVKHQDEHQVELSVPQRTVYDE